MSAIAGLWRLDGRPDAADGLARVLTALTMYGVDDSATWDGRDVALGRRLRRVLPEDVHDRGPLIGAGGAVLVADARIDNREELAAALAIAPRRLAGLCDAEVLLAAYERWQTDAFDRIAGDFACAIWEPASRRLVLACDATARRPLYYHHTDRLFAFATLPKGLHALTEVPYEADEGKLAAYLALLPGATTSAPYAGLERLEAGCYLVVADGALAQYRYWRPQPDTVRLPSADAYVEALRERFDAAVASRLRGVSEVGAHLSGGLDSGAVAATAARLLGERGRVHAFTAVPRAGYVGAGPAWRIDDEGAQAAGVAAMHPNMIHAIVGSVHRSPFEGLDRALALHDQPLLNTANVGWLEAICDAARERGLGVILTGELGNFGPSYDGMELLPELVRGGRGGAWLSQARALRTRGRSWPGLLAASLGPWTPAPLWRLVMRVAGRPAGLPDYSLVHPRHHAALRTRAARSGRDLAGRPAKSGFAARMAVLAGAGSVSWAGVGAYWGLDIRDPTADKRLLEFCLGVPTAEFLRDGEDRSLARRAFADRLPSEVIEPHTRGYQAADWHEALTGARPEVLAALKWMEASPAAARLVDLKRMRRLVDEWPASGWDSPRVRALYRGTLTTALAAGHFLRRVSGSNT